MDCETLKKYFNLGDDVEIASHQSTTIGKIVDFSDTVLVVEDALENPIVIAIDSIVSCRKTANAITTPEKNPNETSEASDNTASVISEIIGLFDEIYKECSISNDTIIPTNATVMEIRPESVAVLTDDGDTIICMKSGIVGYNRENAAIGKRMLTSRTNNGKSYASLTEMKYGELYDKFLRALNTKPKPRMPILGSVIYLFTREFGEKIASQRKTIKQLFKVLNNMDDKDESTSVQANVTYPNKKIALDNLTAEQKKQIYELLEQHIDEMSFISQNEQIKIANALIVENLGISVKRKGIKTIVTDLTKKGSLPSVSIELTNEETNPQEFSTNGEEDDPYLSATCEVNRYYIKYQNGTASDQHVEEIRFKDDVVVEDDLKTELHNFHFWEKNVVPIPVICLYKKIGKWHTALFVTKPGKLSDLRNRILNLRSANRNNLADVVQRYLESNGYYEESGSQIDINISSEDLLNISKRHRLIKNFDEAEKGYLELIKRKYSLDIVVRDLAMTYQEWKKIPDAIDILEKHLPELDDKMKAYNMLFTLYHSTGHDAEAIHIMEQALTLYPGDDNTSIKKRNKIERKIGFVKKKKRKAHFSSEDIPASLLRFDANNTTGEVLAYISDKSYLEKLNFLNQRIGELKNSRELPSYYLAKIQLLEDSGEDSSSKQIKNLLADYCRAKARNFFYDDNNISAREYLLQGISVIEREDLYCLLYLSLCVSSQNVLTMYNSSIMNFDDITSKYKLREDDDSFYVLFRMLKENSIFSKKLVILLYQSDLTSWITDELDIDSDSLSQQAFIDLTTQTAGSYSEFLTLFGAKIDSLISSNNALEICQSLLSIEKPSLKHVSSVDISNLSVIEEISNNILDFEKIIGYEECEELCRNAFGKADAAVSVIQRCPTSISTLQLLPLLLKMKDLLERALNKKYVGTLPHIIISPIDDARPIEDEIEIQISISNEIGFSRANNGVFSINAINGKDVKSLALKNVLEAPLLGGEITSCTFLLKSSVLTTENIELEYSFDYLDVRKIARVIRNKISFAINKGDNYEDFDNPYIAHVKSNAVKDKSMFKGRDETIDNICKYVIEDYKGYVLWGQKRSGKSSVLYHITQKLREGHVAFAVEYTMGNNIVQDAESENESMANLFYTIISEIGRAIKEVNRDVYKESGCHIIRRYEFDEHPDQTFREYLDFYRDIIVDKLHYEQDKIVLIVDEFTYLYYHILEGKISPRIMEFWKGLVESRVFSFVFAGQDAMPRFMDEFQNVFTSMYPQELTYIDEKSARELIEEPIWNKKKNCSRFHPDAVNEILKLTACSPFYIMILCSELVKYARQRKRLPIQVSDVNALVQRMICNESSISRKDFDNLISCGESRLDIIDKDDSLSVLKDIAVKSRNIEFYDINLIKVFDKEKVKKIIDDLLRRGVLEPHAHFANKVKIKVELFKRWLLNHE